MTTKRAWAVGRVVFVGLASMLAASTARAAAYAVTPAGADANPGTPAQPWKTLQHAADMVVAGDSVTVEAGTYAGFSLCWDHPQDGTANAPITFSAKPGVVIDAKNAHTDDGINLEGCSYIVIEGFEVTGMPRAGIRAVSGAANAIGVTIRGNDCHDNAVWGIFTSHVDSLVIEGNRATNSMQQHGVYVSNACVNPTVRGNELAGNAGAGLHMNGDASQGGSGVITGALVEKNVIHDNGASGGSGINCDGVQASRIRNNLVYAEHASGISLYQGDAAQPATGNVVVNNTVVVAADGRWALNVQNGSTGNRVENNILLNLNPSHGAIDIDAASLASFTSDFNVVTNRFTPDDNDFETLAAWQAMTGQDAHSLAALPAALFVGGATGSDFHLVATAPAIGAGTATDAPADDLEGHSRASGIDVGAYERCDDCDADGGADASGSGGAGASGSAGANGAAGAGAAGAGADGRAADGAPTAGQGGGLDAGPAGPSAASSSGCGCFVARGPPGGPAGPALLLIALAWLRARRRG
jgi:MYXO-CTERM domain-containing protein